jgi:mannose-6-phosphate isomerase-like protein (cupin superfamily)
MSELGFDDKVVLIAAGGPLQVLGLEVLDERTRSGLDRGHLLSVFSYDADWDFMERHPVGDELAFLLEGEADVVLGRGHDERRMALRPGHFGVIPEGEWHRLRVRSRCAVLFATPAPALTEHRSL